MLRFDWARLPSVPVGHLTVACAAALLAGCATPAGDPPLPAPVAAADYQRHLERLASDDFQGRKPGTEGERRTVEYLVAEFRRLGLEPGNGDSWIQEVPLVETTTGSDAALRIGGTALRYLDDMVVWSKRTVPEVRLDDSPVVFVGHGIVAPEYGWNDYAGLDMRGKTALILINEPGFASGDAGLFRGRALTYYGRWTYKFEEAARQGAAGAIIVHDTEPAAYPWHTVRNGRIGPQVDLESADGNASRPSIEGWITREAADALLRSRGSSYELALREASQRGFRARALGVAASAAVRNAIRRARSANVVARLPGASRADEAVLYTAHWDHLGQSLARTGDRVFNGAVDNATGTAGLLALAAAFSRERARPARSVLFLAVTAEEAGLLGSAWYVERPVQPLARTVAVLNMDAINYGGPTRDVSVVGWGLSDLQDRLAVAARRQGRVLMPEPTPEKGFYYRSDHFNFAKAGVPSLYLKLGVDDRERGIEWGLARRSEHDLRIYHTVGDEYAPGADLRGGLEDLQLLFEVGRGLARSRDFPAWKPDSEFRAARERSLAGFRREPRSK